MANREELLNHLWRYVINAPLGPTYFSSRIEHAEQRPNDPFADAGLALKRLLAAGAEPRDIAIVCREAAYAATFDTLYAIGDPGVDDDNVLMLFEELLMADPSGMEGRPGSANAA